MQIDSSPRKMNKDSACGVLQLQIGREGIILEFAFHRQDFPFVSTVSLLDGMGLLTVLVLGAVLVAGQSGSVPACTVAQMDADGCEATKPNLVRSYLTW